jgi:uncharacterized RmlC-like cupin family protein
MCGLTAWVLVVVTAGVPYSRWRSGRGPPTESAELEDEPMMRTADVVATCAVVPAGETFRGPQDLAYTAGLYAENAGAHGICMQLVTIPPGARAKAHRHEGHETAAYVLSGEIVVWHGAGLEQRLVARAGDFVYIPAGVPHLPANPSPTETATAVLARTDPHAEESTVLLPALDARIG